MTVARLLVGFPEFQRPPVGRTACNVRTAFWTRPSGYLVSAPVSICRAVGGGSVSDYGVRTKPPGGGRCA